MKEYRKMLQNMFRFQGRARRREFWVVSLLNSAIGCFFYALLFFGSTLAGDSLCYKNGGTVGFSTTGSTVGTILVVPLVLVFLYAAISVIALTVRRYHDAGIPGWVYPICLVGCCLCGLGAIAHLVICFLPSKEDNVYGENPKKPENNEYEDSSGIVVSIVLYVICLFLMVAGVVFNVAKCGLKDGGSLTSITNGRTAGDSKKKTTGNTFNGQEFYIYEDDSTIQISEDLHFVWYKDVSDTSRNYVDGTCEIYYGKEAYSYLTTEMKGNGKSMYNFSEEKVDEMLEAAKEDPMYSKDNMVCMIMRFDYIDLEYEEPTDNLVEEAYCFGFYDGKCFNCYNIETGSRSTWANEKYVEEPSEEGTTVAPEEKTDENNMQEDKTETVEGKTKEDETGTDNGNTSGTGGTYNITIGDSAFTLTPPAGAEDVYSSDYTLSYSYKDINVQYSDSFCEVTEDVLSRLKESYEIHTDGDDSINLSACVEPTETKVGNSKAYYFKVSTVYSDYEYVYYNFLVDIGVGDYLEVTVSGSAEDFTEADAFEIANLGL